MEQQNKNQMLEIRIASTKKLVQCITNLGSKDDNARTMAKMQYVQSVSELMPEGKPNFKEVIFYPTVKNLLIENGYVAIHTLLTLLIKDFSNSIKSSNNLTEDDMIECAGMLIDKSDNFRLEDFVMMFTLAKRGELGAIYNRVDMSVIGNMYEEYWARRSNAGEKIYEDEFREFENKIKDIRKPEALTIEEKKQEETFSKLASHMKNWERELQEERNKEFEEASIKRQAEIERFAKIHNINLDDLKK